MRTTRTAAALGMLTLAAQCAYAGWFGDSVTERFLQPPSYRDAALSPDGHYLAMVRVDGDWYASVTVADLEKGIEWALPPISHAAFRDAKVEVLASRVETVKWIDNGTVALNCANDSSFALSAKGQFLAVLGARYLGVYRPDGAAALETVFWNGTGGAAPGLRTMQPGQPSPSKPFRPISPYDEPLRWLADGTGALRTVTSLRILDSSPLPKLVTRARRSESEPWEVVDERPFGNDPFQPVAITKDPDRILVQARNGGDRLAIWNFDIRQRRFLDVLAASPDSDIVRADNSIAVEGLEDVTTDGLKQQTVWFDERMKALQASVDLALPDHVNVLQPSRSAQVLVESSSDIDPGRLYVLDSRTMKMQFLGARYPALKDQPLQPMQALHYPSFDGMQVPAYLTLPGRPSGPAPTIVLIHGGPQARDRWGFNSEVQVLAAHGYAVFQPQFRGSAGFGKAFEEAGYGQWGQAMQDDITAGVRYLVDQGIADPKRICIVGASYGGYAALWGLARTPELYKCGVSVAGVSDLELMLHDDSDINQNSFLQAVNRSLVGDPDLMKATWDSVSPLKHADRIRAPLLIVHGKLDRRVPIIHGEKMRDVMKAQHKDVKWLELENEGHAIVYADDLKDLYSAMFKLFERTIGKGEPSKP